MKMVDLKTSLIKVFNKVVQWNIDLVRFVHEEEDLVKPQHGVFQSEWHVDGPKPHFAN